MNLTGNEIMAIFVIMIVVIGCLPLVFKSYSSCNSRFVMRGMGFKEDAEEML